MKNRIPVSLKLPCFLFLIADSSNPAPDEIIKPQDPVGIACNPDNVYFNMNLLPLLASSFGKPNCHDAATHKKGVFHTNYINILQIGAVEPSNPAGSEVNKIISGNGKEGLIPPSPNPALSTYPIRMVYKWISQGTKSLRCDNLPCDTINNTYPGSIWPIIQDNCTGCHTSAYAGRGTQLLDHAIITAGVGPNGRLFGSINMLQVITKCQNKNFAEQLLYNPGKKMDSSRNSFKIIYAYETQ
jgi:hypothetical protein